MTKSPIPLRRLLRHSGFGFLSSLDIRHSLFELTPHASRLWLALWFWFCASPFARADDPFTAFDQANKLYEQGRFKDAAAAYENMARNGQASPALYFNLGNALFKAGEVGRAILNYRLAERLAPRDPDIRANLKFVRNGVGAGATAPAPWWQRWTGHLTLNEWTVLTAGALWLWFGLLALGQWRPVLRKSLSGYTATVGVGAAVLALCLGVAGYNRFGITTAIVTANEATVRLGPLDESPSYFTVPGGAELTVLDSKGDWLQVSDGVKRPGWLRREQVVFLPRPGRFVSS